MQQVQARKQRMIAGALTDQEVRTARIEELKMLFRWICMMKFIFDERRNSEGFFFCMYRPKMPNFVNFDVGQW